MPHVEIGEVTLHYELSGNVSGPCLMFSNSLGTNLEMWRTQMSTFEPHFAVLRYDMRGHRSSSVPSGPYTIATLGRDVLRLLDVLGLQKIAFCGLSVGGAIGQWLAANAPHRLRCVVLCNTAAKIGSYDGWNDRISRIRIGGIGSIADAVIEKWFTDSFRESHPDVVASFRKILVATNPQGYIACCEAIRDMDQRNLVKEIQIPTLIVAGEFDSATSVAQAEALKQWVDQSALRVVPGSHISNVEAASEFNSVLLEFLERVFI